MTSLADQVDADLHIPEGEGRLWDDGALDDVFRTDYVWSVLITDGKGVVLKRLERQERSERSAEIVDISVAAALQMGKRLSAGPLKISANLYESAMVVSARGTGGVTTTILAAANANLGQLLSGIKRVLV